MTPPPSMTEHAMANPPSSTCDNASATCSSHTSHTDSAAQPSGMERLLPNPWLSVVLALAWLLLQGLSVIHGIAAVLIGLCLPLLLKPLLAWSTAPYRSSGINFKPIPHLAFVVLLDIVKSNWIVACQAFGRIDTLQPAWFAVPLHVQHPHAISLLAAIITNTPGTVSCHIDEEQRHILVHALHCTDVAATIADIHQRYQMPLARIFHSSIRTEPQP